MSEPKEAPKMDAADLWSEDMFTDRKVGVIRRLNPVKPDGSPDPARKPTFVGEASLMTPGGALPLSFEIPAADLSAAVAGYGAALEKALQEAMEELKELRRRASSQIVIPQGGMPPGGLGGGLTGPGGGKLKL
jgi:hypothetical protein